VVLEAVFSCIRVSDSINAAFCNLPSSSDCNEVSLHGSFGMAARFTIDVPNEEVRGRENLISTENLI
jgi:hypothetical protein